MLKLVSRTPSEELNEKVKLSYSDEGKAKNLLLLTYTLKHLNKSLTI